MYNLAQQDFSYARIMKVAKKIDPSFNSSSYVIAYNLLKTEVGKMKEQVDGIIEQRAETSDYKKINLLTNKQLNQLSNDLLLLMFVLHIDQ